MHYIRAARETGPWSVGDWMERRDALDAAFKALDADVVAFQEMESFSRGSVRPANLTLDWLTGNNPGYGVAAAGDPTVFPDTQPILYRRDRLREVDRGWFFFSRTPDRLYARTFDGGFPAFASWATFEERGGERRFTVFNVHFDYASSSNRRLSAGLVAARIRPRVAAGETVFVAGDINAGIRSTPARLIAAEGPEFAMVRGSTYHFNRGLDLTPAIDHIAATPDARPVGEAFVLRGRFAGDWPSDHYPVLADFTLGRP